MLLGLVASVVMALQVTSGGEASEWCSAEGDRMTFIVYGVRAESYTVRADAPDEIQGPSEWVLVGGEWRQTDLSPRYRRIAPLVVFREGEMVYSYSVMGERRERVWLPCS